MAHLASDLLPESFDVIVDGTGLTLGLIAAALARTGRSVLHLDRSGFYGELWATLLHKDFEEWLSEHISGKGAEEVPVGPIPELEGKKRALVIRDTPRTVSNVVDFIPHNPQVAPKEDLDTAKPTPQETGQSPSQPIQSPDQPIQSPDQPIQSPDQPIQSPDQPIQSPDQPIQSPDQPIQSPDQPTQYPSQSPDQPNPPEQEGDKSSVSSDVPSKVTGGDEGAGEGTGEEKPPGGVPARQTWQSVDKRWFNYDLMPKPLYCRGDMINSLTETNIGRYLEFRAISKLFTRTGDKIEQVPCSREDVFSSKAISMVEKRRLMKFLTFCVDFEKHPEEYQAHETIPYSEYLQLKGHSQNLVHYIAHTIAMVDDRTTTIEGLRSTQLFIRSLGRFGNAPFLFPIYGSGELPQSFCRFSAVWGSVYCLKRYVQALVMEEDKLVGVVCSSGQKIACKAVVTSAKNLRTTVDFHGSLKTKRLSRAIYITDGPLESTDGVMTVVTIPPLSLGSNQSRPLHLLQLDPLSSCTVAGTYMIHVTVESAQTTAHDDLHVVAKTFFNIEGHNDCNKGGPNLLRAIYFNVDTVQVDQSQSSTLDLPKDLCLVSDPDDSVSYEAAMKEAKEVFHQLCPGESFLPATPSPEDIIYDDTPSPGQPADNGEGGTPKLTPTVGESPSNPPTLQPANGESPPNPPTVQTADGETPSVAQPADVTVVSPQPAELLKNTGDSHHGDVTGGATQT